MKSTVTFMLGIVVGLASAFVFLLVFRSPTDTGSRAEIALLKQRLGTADQAAQRDREALRAAQKELHAAQTEIGPRPQTSVRPPASAPTAVQTNAPMTGYLGDPV